MEAKYLPTLDIESEKDGVFPSYTQEETWARQDTIYEDGKLGEQLRPTTPLDLEYKESIEQQEGEEGDLDLESSEFVESNLSADDIVFDSIAAYFMPKVFIVQLLAHLFVPLSFILINYKAQGFMRKSKGFDAEFFGIMPLMVYLMVLSYYMMPYSDREAVRGAIWLPLLLFVQHKVVISLKYASLSETEYERVQRETSECLTNRNLFQTQLLFGWLCRDPTLLKFELACAAARINAKINELYFTLPRPGESAASAGVMAHWNAFLRNNERIDLQKPLCHSLMPQSDGTYTVSLFRVGMALLQAPENSHNLHKFRAVFEQLFRLVIAAIPIIKISMMPGFFSRSIMLYLFLIKSTMINWTFGWVFMNILFVALIDSNRLLLIMRRIHQMIRLSDVGDASSRITFGASKHPKSRDRRTQAQMRTVFSIANADHSVEMSSLRSKSRSPLSRSSVRAEKSVRKEKMSSSSPTRTAVSAAPPAAGWGGASVYDAGDAVKSLRMPPLHSPSFSPPNLKASSKASPSVAPKNHRDRDEPRRAGFAEQEQQQEQEQERMLRRFTHFGQEAVHEEDRARVPRLSFRIAENITSWTYLRLVFQHFGDRFRIRIDLFTGGTALVMLALMLNCLVVIFQSENRVAEFQTAFFIQSMSTVLFLWIFMLAFLTYGSFINEAMEIQSRTLSAHALRISDEIDLLRTLCVDVRNHHLQQQYADDAADDDDDDDDEMQLQKDNQASRRTSGAVPLGRIANTSCTRYSAGGAGGGGGGIDRADISNSDHSFTHEDSILTLERALERIESCREMIDSYAAFKPYKILGVRVNFGVVVSLFTGGVTFAGVLYQLFSTGSADV